MGRLLLADDIKPVNAAMEQDAHGTSMEIAGLPSMEGVERSKQVLPFEHEQLQGTRSVLLLGDAENGD